MLLIGAEQGFLNDVFRIVLIAGHAVRQAENGLVVALGKYTEILHSLYFLRHCEVTPG